MAWEIHPHTKERKSLGKVCSFKTQKKAEREIRKFFKKGFIKNSSSESLIVLYPMHDVTFIEIKNIK